MTAVEWLVKELELEGYDHTIRLAKAMEKQQIMDAYGHDLHPMFDGDAEQYYNSKFVNHESKKV